MPKKLLILPFSKLTKKDAKIAGGKGASLGEMTRAKIPVPPGFVLLAEAFDLFIDPKSHSSVSEVAAEIIAILC